MMSVLSPCSRQCRASSFTADCPGPCTTVISFCGAAISFCGAATSFCGAATSVCGAAGLASSFMAGAGGTTAGLSPCGAWPYTVAEGSAAMIAASTMRFMVALLSNKFFTNQYYTTNTSAISQGGEETLRRIKALVTPYVAFSQRG